MAEDSSSTTIPRGKSSVSSIFSPFRRMFFPFPEVELFSIGVYWYSGRPCRHNVLQVSESESKIT